MSSTVDPYSRAEQLRFIELGSQFKVFRCTNPGCEKLGRHVIVFGQNLAHFVAWPNLTCRFCGTPPQVMVVRDS